MRPNVLLYLAACCVILFTVCQARNRGRNRENILHLSIDRDQAGYQGNPVLHTNATAIMALTIPYWTMDKNNRKPNEDQDFAQFNRNNGTITILSEGLYNIYSSLAYYRYRRSYSQYMVRADNKVIMKCKRAEIFEAQKGDGKWMRISMCQTDGYFYLYKGQNLEIISGNVNWRIFADIDVSYWGLIKM